MESFFPVPVSQPSISVLPFSFDEHGLLQLPADESAITLVSPWAVVNSPSSAFSYHASTLAPLFVQPPHWSDINQQQLGNCWFLASICSILNLPDGTLRVLQMMREEGGFVFVRLFDKQKKAHYIKLEKSIVYSLGGSEYHAKMGSGLGTWPVFLEFERRNGRLNVLVARALLDSIQRFNLLPGKRGTGIYAPSQLTTYNTLLALCQAGTPTTASTRAYLGRSGDVGDEHKKQYQNDTVKGLVPNHEYSVKSVSKSGNQCLIKLINPWGRVGRRLVTDEPDRRPFASIRSTPVAETENAVFDLDLDDFTKRFDYISHTNEKLRDLGS